MKQYRTLNDGEIVMAGDEFWGVDRSWIPATEIGKKVTSYTHKMYRRPMTETSSQTTDICPDCSNHPCDCGLPAGYEVDIRFAANFAPHIKVMEASKFAEIIKERDDLLRYNEAFRQDTLICANCDAISKKEYDQAIEQLTAAREEIKELNDKLDDAVADATNAVNDIIRMKWQRDRLAEALEKVVTSWDEATWLDEIEFESFREALQSLNQPTEP